MVNSALELSDDLLHYLQVKMEKSDSDLKGNSETDLDLL
jgi:hypothetical protein